MVILLHREDAYEKESPRAGEADLIVAKHRNGPTDTIAVAFQGHFSRFTTWPTTSDAMSSLMSSCSRGRATGGPHGSGAEIRAGGSTVILPKAGTRVS